MVILIRAVLSRLSSLILCIAVVQLVQGTHTYSCAAAGKGTHTDTANKIANLMTTIKRLEIVVQGRSIA